MTLTEGSLHKWFNSSKSKDGKKGWVNVKTGGTCASDEPGEGTPKCVSSSKRASMTKAERDSASRRKKAADPNQQSKSGAAKPTYVRTDAKKKMKESLSWQQFSEKCWDGYTQKGMKKKGKRVVPNCVKEEDKKGKGSGSKDACYHKVKASAKVWPSAYASGRLVQCRKKGAANYGNKSEEVQVEGAAWTKKSGKNKSGGLNEKGRKSYERENPGSDLKAPSKKVGNPRRKSFCARMKGMKKKLTSAKTARDPDSRINKSLRAWNCGYEPQGQMIESTKHGVDGEKYLKLPKKYEKLAKDKSDYRSALGKAKDAVTDKLGKTNTDRDGVKDSSKKLFTMQNGYEPQGDIIEGINFAAFRKKSADVKKKPEKAMDAGAKARRSMQRREYAKTVSGSTDRVPKDLED